MKRLSGLPTMAIVFAAALTCSPAARAAPPRTPTGLRAVTGGNSIAVIWGASTGDTTIGRYNVYRDGLQIATTIAGSRPGTVYLQGTRYEDQSIGSGGTYSYQVQAIDGNNVVSALSNPLQVTAPTATTPVPQILVDTSGAPDLANWANSVVVPELQEWYPKISDLIAFPDYVPPASYTIVFDPNTQGVAATDARNLVIRVNPAYARANPNDLGMFVHESTHIIQQAFGYGRGWIIEGAADWSREHPYHDRDPVVPLATDSYIEGYSMGSNLLNWATEHYNPSLIRRLTVAMHFDTYSDTDQFVTVTGLTPDQAWAAMTGFPLVTGSITASAARGNCVDNLASGQSNGNPIDFYGCTGTENQLWSAVPNGDQTLTLRINGQWCLDVTSSGTANGTPVQLWGCNFGLAQKWVVNGTALVNPNSGRCLDAGDMTRLRRLQIADCSGSTAQQWHMGTATPVGTIRHTFLNTQHNPCVDASSAGGNLIVVADCGGKPQEQKWLVVPNVGNTATIMIQSNCLGASGTANGTGVFLAGCNNSGNQQWVQRVDTIKSGLIIAYRYTLVNPLSGRCLSTHVSAPNGTQFQLQDCGGTTYDQAWRLPH